MEDMVNVSAGWEITSGVPWQKVRADWYVRGDNPTTSRMDCGLVTKVTDNLYQGGCVQDVELGSDFDTVVSLYPWERYSISDNVDRIEITMYDSRDGVLEEDLFKASDAVLAGLEKGKVLVHCQAGLNRSGLVTAFTLMRQGMSVQDAIDMLRKQRSPLVLCNKTFVKQLHDLENRRDEWM